MAVTISSIDDKVDGFRVEFTVTTQYSQKFAPRPANINQMDYAREQVEAVVTVPVEDARGVIVVPKPVLVRAADTRIDRTPEAVPKPVPLPIVEELV